MYILCGADSKCKRHDTGPDYILLKVYLAGKLLKRKFEHFM